MGIVSIVNGCSSTMVEAAKPLVPICLIDDIKEKHLLNHRPR